MDNIQTQAQEAVTSVYRTLSDGTKQIIKLRAETSAIESKINSGRYSASVVKEYKAKTAELSKSARMKADAAIKAAYDVIETFRKDGETRRNTLNPAEITQDIELLKAGVPLKQNDLEAILERSPNNVTMFHLVNRFAKEHGIQISGKYTLGEAEDERLAKTLSQVTHYYERWINTPKARKMLRTFYNVTFPTLNLEELEEE
jgi:uncharacterized protein (DUF4415 family)